MFRIKSYSIMIHSIRIHNMFIQFQIFGLGTFAIGVVVQIMYSSGADLIETNFLSAPSLLIFIGLIIVVVALFGCCGAAKENYCMIMSVKYFDFVQTIIS